MDTIRRALFTFTMIIAAFAVSTVSVRAQSATASYIVIDATTGHGLDGQDTGRKLQVASLTKGSGGRIEVIFSPNNFLKDATTCL